MDKLGKCHQEKGIYSAAEQVCLEAIKEFKGFPMAHRSHFRLSPTCSTRGLWEDAIQAIQGAIELLDKSKTMHGKEEDNCDANLLAYRHNMPACFEGQGDYESAIGACKSALELDPRQMKTSDQIGILLMLMGKDDEAETFCRQLVGQQPAKFEKTCDAANNPKAVARVHKNFATAANRASGKQFQKAFQSMDPFAMSNVATQNRKE